MKYMKHREKKHISYKKTVEERSLGGKCTYKQIRDTNKKKWWDTKFKQTRK